MLSKELKILIVEDDEDIRNEIKLFIRNKVKKNNGFLKCELFEAKNIKESLEIINNKQVDIVLLDIWLEKGENGIELLKKIKELDSSIEVIMVTSDDADEFISNCVKLGVNNYIKKPFKEEDIIISIEIAQNLRARSLEERLQKIMLSCINDYSRELVGNTDKIIEVKKAIAQISKYSRITVLIRGESGTGKELVACALHREYGDTKRPFVAINCGAVSKDLIESELYNLISDLFAQPIKI